MDISYVKESFLLIQNFNDEVKTFKSRIIDTTYLYEKNKNNDFEKNIKEIQNDMKKYLNSELMKEKEEEKGIPKYYILIIILCYIFTLFLYINNIELIAYVMVIMTTAFTLIIIIIYNNYYKSSEGLNRNIKLLDNVCNNLIYSNIKSKD